MADEFQNINDISDQDFKRAVLLGLQACSGHLCAMTLNVKKPNPMYNQSPGRGQPKDRNRFVPLTVEEQQWHIGTQYMFNSLVDKLFGTDESDPTVTPHQVTTPDTNNNEPPDNVTTLVIDDE